MKTESPCFVGRAPPDAAGKLCIANRLSHQKALHSHLTKLTDTVRSFETLQSGYCGSYFLYILELLIPA